MKIIGFLTAWACEDWIEYSIKQALGLVDELIIAIGAFHKHFKKIEDNTYEIAKKYLKNKKIKVIQTVCEKKNTPDLNKCATLNKMLQVSENIEVGNVIWILDADEFYSKEAIEEIKNFIKNYDFEEIYVTDRMFCINFNYYILHEHSRILKIRSNQCFFVHLQVLMPRAQKKTVLLKNNPMFHYSMLMGEQMKGIQWMLENVPFAVLWHRKIYNKYDPENEDFWLKKNQELTGNYRFWRDAFKGIKEKNDHGLFKYNGKHPEIIENSPLREISDFRKFMKNKPNYDTYLKTMKTIITEKKKFDFKKLITQIRNKKIWKKYIVEKRQLLIEFNIFKLFNEKITKFIKFIE